MRTRYNSSSQGKTKSIQVASSNSDMNNAGRISSSSNSSSNYPGTSNNRSKSGQMNKPPFATSMKALTYIKGHMPSIEGITKVFAKTSVSKDSHKDAVGRQPSSASTNKIQDSYFLTPIQRQNLLDQSSSSINFTSINNTVGGGVPRKDNGSADVSSNSVPQTKLPVVSDNNKQESAAATKPTASSGTRKVGPLSNTSPTGLKPGAIVSIAHHDEFDSHNDLDETASTDHSGEASPAPAHGATGSLPGIDETPDGKVIHGTAKIIGKAAPGSVSTSTSSSNNNRNPNKTSSSVIPGKTETTLKDGKLCCDKCDGNHKTEECPYYKKQRDNHPDAQKNKQIGGAISLLPCNYLYTARVVRQPGDGSCLFHSLSYGIGQGYSASR